MPLDLEPPVACTVVQATTSPPFLGRGTIVSQAGDTLEVDVPALPATVAAGETLVLKIDGPRGLVPVIVEVADVAPGRLRVAVRRVPDGEQREYPRVDGVLQVRYRVARGGAEEEDAWLEGGIDSAADHAPDPYMNLSVTGLMFEDEPVCKEGDSLLLSLQAPGHPEIWPAVGRVVRVQVIPVDERDDSVCASHRVAVAFTRLPPDGAEGLRRLTVRIQDAWMAHTRGVGA